MTEMVKSGLENTGVSSVELYPFLPPPALQDCIEPSFLNRFFHSDKTKRSVRFIKYTIFNEQSDLSYIVCINAGLNHGSTSQLRGKVHIFRLIHRYLLVNIFPEPKNKNPSAIYQYCPPF